ncbi:A/G-specific adenine glycosylase [Botrimarina hoheduenensis]|uniref:Adenine DNA glycosylase n=1 Tax=Botrimarina hoheduenensis TaxID=2528000 RepID=A0A5C5WA34_9BACT|nr:A/G-specific adenine glycosylase [Botrimarina hoheduenensis]TWT47738.1 A/G-specific adenine glycosylase [Botrimarina hoheduenensis]
MTRPAGKPLTADKPRPAAWKDRFRKRLLAWYATHRRDLPWRQDGDPYRVWVSEVMLQQTQVETVRAYFERFMTAFPTVEHLAAADEQQVLRLWEGLGYYRRARSLHAAARRVTEEHAGVFPADLATLQTLPGIGRYTAGAIVSIAFGKRAPILEANTIRLLTRLIAYEGDPTRSAGQKRLWSLAEELLPTKNVADFNQALMELGSLVCTPTSPACPRCPVETLCEARRQGVVGKLAPTTKKLVFADVREAAVVVRKGAAVLVRQCAADERWAGLWDFPRFSLDAEESFLVRDEIADKVRDQTGVRCEVGTQLLTLKHGVTRFRITLEVYEAHAIDGRIARPGTPRWLKPVELSDLPLSVTARKIAKRLVAE